MKNIQIRFFAFFAIACSLFLAACSCSKHDPDPRYVTTDYSAADNWLVNPQGEGSKAVDIFYLYPTTYSGAENSCPVTDAGMRAGATKNRQSNASVYEQTANLYMPFYRQMSASYVLTLPEAEHDKAMREIPAVDALEAFKYYIEHYNGGRPFLLAGHSQGSNTLLYVIEYLKGKPELMERFIAAYIIGYSVTPDFLQKNPHVSFAQGRTDQKVLISWNTESPGLTVPNPVVTPGALAINPITWTTEETLAGADQSLGARLEENGAFVDQSHFADAQVNRQRGVVVCSTVDPEDYRIPIAIFPLGVLHGCDYPFYYYDLQQNVADRVAAYFPSNP